jgi:signal peptide peptidase SppA
MSFIFTKLKELSLRSKVIAGLTGAYLGNEALGYVNPKPTISVITLEGTIIAGKGTQFGKKNINLETTRKMIDNAFKQKNLKLVCVNVNSPGGSAVQSDLVSQYIKGKSEKHKVDVVVFCEDTAASGGYWLACTGKQIFATRSSVVGSIGVISQGLGFHEIIKKYGIESRVFTAGENKAVMNPLEPLKESDIQIIRNLLSSLHEHFIEHVKANRGDRLKADDKTLFNGEFWTGKKALELGLIDGIDTLDGYIQREYGDEVKVYRAKMSGGLSDLLSAFVDPDFSILNQLTAANQLTTANQLTAANQFSGSSFSLDQQNSRVCTPTAEDPMAFKFSQENVHMK